MADAPGIHYFVPCELVGGPRNGQRLMMAHPAPPVIVTHDCRAWADISLSLEWTPIETHAYRCDSNEPVPKIAITDELLDRSRLGANELLHFLAYTADTVAHYNWQGNG